jgi:hypothetical protein
MTQSQLLSWIESHYGKGRWLSFAVDLNAVRESKGLKPLSNQAISNWLHTAGRNPPAWLDAYLPLIEARLANPEAAIIYQIPLALTEKENKILIRTAKRAHTSPDDFLRICARIGFENQCGIE